MRCRVCGNNASFLELSDGLCKRCQEQEQAIAKIKAELAAGGTVQRRLTAAEEIEAINQKAKFIVVTTSHQVSGRDAYEELGLVAAEVGFGLNIFKDIANSWRDTFGGRSDTIQNALRDGREEALLQLKRDAFERGADAVISTRIEYNQVSTNGGTGGSILFVAAYGTAVKLKSPIT